MIPLLSSNLRQMQNTFFNYLNSQHTYIEFTIDEENEGKLPFLDILVRRTGDLAIEMEIYRKPTFSGLGLNFLSECSFKYKLNNISTLLFRAYRLSSNYMLFHREVTFLKSFFNNNGFTDNLFFKKVRNVLNTVNQNDEPPVCSKDLKHFRFPFISNKINNSIENKNEANK